MLETPNKLSGALEQSRRCHSLHPARANRARAEGGAALRGSLPLAPAADQHPKSVGARIIIIISTIVIITITIIIVIMFIIIIIIIISSSSSRCLCQLAMDEGTAQQRWTPTV